MPSNWMAIDQNFPTFTGEESPQQQIQALHNYLFQLREGLQYSLRNLTTENFNAVALQQQGFTEKQDELLFEWFHSIIEQLMEISGKLNNLATGITVAEDGAVTVGTAGKSLNLVGEIYINGVRYEQEGGT